MKVLRGIKNGREVEMTKRQEVRLERMTRREFRERLESGELKVAIIPTGSIEQHLEHLTMDHDITSSTYIAEQIAFKLYPHVVVAVPIAVGISEHHMFSPGTLTVKPESWLSVLFDVVESFLRHGLKRVLILNGHFGNVPPLDGIWDQWRLYFQREHPDAVIHFRSYWDFLPPGFVLRVLTTKRFPGHAQEFETSIALYAFPENVRLDALNDQEDNEPSEASPEKGRKLVEKIVAEAKRFVEDMMMRGTRAPD